MVRLSIVAPSGATLLFVYRDGALLTTIDAARRSYTDRNVAARTTYTYEIVAWSANAGESAVSAQKSATTRG